MTPPLPPVVALATTNLGKRAELAELLAACGARVVVPDGLPEVVEDAPTYTGNAAAKAVSAAVTCGIPALADDAGLEVEAWSGAPGLTTRRWAEEVGGWASARALVGEAGGRGVFRCAVALAWPPPGRVVTGDGSVSGRLVHPTVAGGGLEPCFVADGTDRPLPALSAAERDRVHHRHRAFRELLAALGAS